MKTKIFLQEILIKVFGNTWLFAWWIKKHRLDDHIVDFLIREKFNLLEKYARRHQLSSYQITDILSDLADVDDEYTQAFIRELLKNNTLNREQEQLLVSKNDVLFLESYLTPNGYFDASRRFHEVAEHNYILGMAEAKNMTGIEVFKAYVDNTCRDMMTDELLAELILLCGTFCKRRA